MGAVLVLVADNIYNCDDENINGEPCQYSPPVLVDDGTAEDIMIPTILMPKADANSIKQELAKGTIVQVEFTFSIPNTQNVVEYELWTTPWETTSSDFIESFAVVATALGSQARFTPHLKITNGTNAYCVGEDGENLCSNLCVNGGRYCADPHGEINGATIVVESLRSLCVWKLYGERNGIGAEWWGYTHYIQSFCWAPSNFGNPICVQGAFDQVGINTTAVNLCMEESGGTTEPTKNYLLDSELAADDDFNCIVDGVAVPSAFVNDEPLAGALSGHNILSAICAGFPQEMPLPTICEQCMHCQSDLVDCAQNGSCQDTNSPIDSLFLQPAMELPNPVQPITEPLLNPLEQPTTESEQGTVISTTENVPPIAESALSGSPIHASPTLTSQNQTFAPDTIDATEPKIADQLGESSSALTETYHNQTTAPNAVVGALDQTTISVSAHHNPVHDGTAETEAVGQVEESPSEDYPSFTGNVTSQNGSAAAPPIASSDFNGSGVLAAVAGIAGVVGIIWCWYCRSRPHEAPVGLHGMRRMEVV